MYALHVINSNCKGKSPQILHGKHCNSYNQKYLQWPFFGNSIKKDAYIWCALAVTQTSVSTSSGTNARGAGSSSVVSIILVDIGLIVKKCNLPHFTNYDL